MKTLVQTFEELQGETLTLAGGKGSSLARLEQAGFPVPDGFVILPDAFAGDDLLPEAWRQVQNALVKLRASAPNAAFAVRSSALSEDSAQASFAGEFESVLNVQTDDDIREAICTVYLSRHGERVQVYSQAKGMDTTHPMAVIVQILAPAECSGVLFTANPITGQRDQCMINAAWGLGEAIVGGLVTPDTVIVDPAKGKVLSRETADKQVMTVRLGSYTEEQSTPEDKRRAPVLSDQEVVRLAQLGEQIEDLYGMPLDIEWAMVGGEIVIVQARPITTLPDPIPTKWQLPKGAYSAMRNNIVELMADPLTPLFGTLGLAAINTSMHRILDAFFNGRQIMPDDMIISVNDYAYYNGSIKMGPMLYIFWDSIGIMRRMFTGAVERWTETGRPHYMATVAQWQEQNWREFSTVEILAAVRELAEAAVDAYGSMVSGVIPAAWMTEALFTTTYKLLIKRRNDPLAPTYLLGFDSIPLQAEKDLYDLAKWAQTIPALAAYLSDTPSAQLAEQLDSEQAPAGVTVTYWQTWQARIRQHLQTFGHAIYNLDFSNPVAADDPAQVLETVKLFLSGQGVNPYTRQEKSAAKREEAIQVMEQRLKGLRLKLFRKLLGMAQRFAPLREDALTDVGMSYPLLREMLREVGRRFVENGVIVNVDDIFWLTQDEVEQAATQIDQGQSPESLAAHIPQRKVNWQAARRNTPPIMLPQIKIFGFDIMSVKSGRKGHSRNTIKGVAASPGTVTGPARVIHGPEDFGQMQMGEILVAALTTPAWTPLFARAAAVVTDVGGPLSHGSIVAREYGIPAVLGTGEATRRIHSGQMITVDGSTGMVALTEN